MPILASFVKPKKSRRVVENLEKILANFHDRLRYARNLIGISQSEFAKEIGVGNRTYARYEAGGGYPDVELLQKIGSLTGINMNWLIMGGSEAKTEVSNDEEIIKNSVENKIRRNIQSNLNNFQHEIIFLHFALEKCSCVSYEELINFLHDFKIELITATLQHGITKSDKESAINFLEEMQPSEKNFLLNNINSFRRMIWENMTWFNKIFKTTPS